MTGSPEFSADACAVLSPDDRERLWQVARTLVDERGLIVRITQFVGQGADWAGAKASEYGAKLFGDGWEVTFKQYAEEALWKAHDVATFGLDPNGEREPWSWFNKAVASVTGAAGGFFGLPGMAIDIPISTLMIMRSIAEIARANGEDIGSDDGKRACLEVMAFGGPESEDDDAEVGYWSTRALLAHAVIEIAIKQVAARYSVVLSEKAIAQLVPLAGALAGGGLNYVFMDFYQQMARVHFTIRALERSYGENGAVRTCFAQLVRQARERRQIRKPTSPPVMSDRDSTPGLTNEEAARVVAPVESARLATIDGSHSPSQTAAFVAGNSSIRYTATPGLKAPRAPG